MNPIKIIAIGLSAGCMLQIDSTELHSSKPYTKQMIVYDYNKVMSDMEDINNSAHGFVIILEAINK